MKLKRFVISFLTVALLIPAVYLSASALIINDGDFGYELNTAKHEAVVVKYNGTADKVVLPTVFQGYPVTTVDRNAFTGNKNIKEVVFSGSITTVEEYAFMDCTSLETVYIPENVKGFGDRVFAGCTSLKTVTLLSDITSMPTNMFSGCTSLTDLTINPRISEFSYGCFNGCSQLSDLGFVSNGVLLQSYCFNGTAAESIVLSDSLIAIPNYAFTNCQNLKYVTIPESVIMIQPYAFDFSKVTIRCYYDSMAYLFAYENELSYELLDNAILGDANGDGHVNINDVTTIQRYKADMETLEGINFHAADINGDGNVTIEDATILQRFFAEYDDITYPVGEVITQ